MGIEKKTNTFSFSEEILVNQNRKRSQVYTWTYGREQSLPIWFHFVNFETWDGKAQYIHKNPTCTSFEIILEGSMHITINDRKHIVRENELLILPSGEPNVLEVKEGGFCRKFALGFCGTLIQPLLAFFHLPGNEVIKLKDTEKIFSLAERARPLLAAVREDDVPALSGLAVETIMEISRQSSSYHSRLLGNAIYLMNYNQNKKLKISDIAAELNVSQKKLIEIFQQEMGISPIQYFINLKMQNAEALLLNSTMSVAEIAEQTGYATSSIFIREFRKKFGKSPHVYRKKKR